VALGRDNLQEGRGCRERGAQGQGGAVAGGRCTPVDGRLAEVLWWQRRSTGRGGSKGMGVGGWAPRLEALQRWLIEARAAALQKNREEAAMQGCARGRKKHE
jgi:hypothetical protein